MTEELSKFTLGGVVGPWVCNRLIEQTNTLELEGYRTPASELEVLKELEYTYEEETKTWVSSCGRVKVTYPTEFNNELFRLHKGLI